MVGRLGGAGRDGRQERGHDAGLLVGLCERRCPVQRHGASDRRRTPLGRSRRDRRRAGMCGGTRPGTPGTRPVVVDLTPRRDGRPARLLDVVEGRSGTVFADWLASRSEEFRRNVRVVAMDAFAGYMSVNNGECAV